MKLKLILVQILAIVLFSGCLATKQPVIVANPDGTLTTNQVYAPAPVVGQIVAGGNAIAPLVPAPFGGFIPIITSLIAAGAAAYAAHQNKQKKNWQGVATTVIEGVESLGATAKAAKEAIAATAITKGNADKVEAAVQKIV